MIFRIEVWKPWDFPSGGLGVQRLYICLVEVWELSGYIFAWWRIGSLVVIHLPGGGLRACHYTFAWWRFGSSVVIRLLGGGLGAQWLYI